MPEIPIHVSSGNIGTSQIGQAPRAAFGDSSGLEQIGAALGQASNTASQIGQVLKQRATNDARRDVTIALKEDELAVKQFQFENEDAENLEELTIDFTAARAEKRVEGYGKRKEAANLYTQSSRIMNAQWAFEGQKRDVETRHIKYGQALDEHSEISDALIYNAAKDNPKGSIPVFTKEWNSFKALMKIGEESGVLTNPEVIEKMENSFAPMAHTLVNTVMGTDPALVEEALDAVGNLIDGKQKGVLLRQSRNQVASNASRSSYKEKRAWGNNMSNIVLNGEPLPGYDTEKYIQSRPEGEQELLRDELDINMTSWGANVAMGAAPVRNVRDSDGNIIQGMESIAESWLMGAQDSGKDLVYQGKLSTQLALVLKHNKEMFVDDTATWAMQDPGLAAEKAAFTDLGVHPDREFNQSVLEYMKGRGVPSSNRTLLSTADAEILGTRLFDATRSAGTDEDGSTKVKAIYDEIEARFHNDPVHVDIAKTQVLEKSGLKLSHAMAYDMFGVDVATQIVAKMGSGQAVDTTFGSALTKEIWASGPMGLWMDSHAALGYSEELGQKQDAMAEIVFAASVMDSAHLGDVEAAAKSGLDRVITGQSIFLMQDENRHPVRVPAGWARSGPHIEDALEAIKDRYDVGNQQGMQASGVFGLMSDADFNEKVERDGYWGTGPDDKGAYLMIKSSQGNVPIPVLDENGDPIYMEWGELEKKGIEMESEMTTSEKHFGLQGITTGF